MIKPPCRIALVGATGAVGEAIAAILAERDFPVAELVPLASERSAGGTVAFGKRQLTVRLLEDFDFSGIDIAFFAAGGAVSAVHAPRAAAAGAVVIDNSSHFRQEPDVPLVVSEVNPQALAQRPRGIIANPNCSTMQMLVALAPIHRAVGIERINVASYQSVSGAGRVAMEELGRQTSALLNFHPVEPKVFPVQIAFNVIPQIDEFLDNGYTREEMKMVWETRKILGDDQIQVNATCVRVPVFYGHALACHIETRERISASRARTLLRQAPGVKLVDGGRSGVQPGPAPRPGSVAAKGRYPTPVGHAAGSDQVHVGRIREDISHASGLNLWLVADNIRKGAALNAVQVAELLVESLL
ncbi:MAG: aspartate-semialdehyde dehydrogenase [Xanthomonadales bacterium]|nr:aspartate-semialdehyde dehydrogenase [Xanthomonadales bacterium]